MPSWRATLSRLRRSPVEGFAAISPLSHAKRRHNSARLGSARLGELRVGELRVGAELGLKLEQAPAGLGFLGVGERAERQHFAELGDFFA